MANNQTEVMDGEVYKSINRELKKLTDTHTYTALPTRVVQEAMKDLDPGSFTVWLQLYIQSYFKDGEITIQLREIAEGMGIAKSTVESKIKILIETGYLKKRQNFDTSKKYETCLASTFYVVAPERIFNLVKESKTRTQCYKGAGQLLVGSLQGQSDIKAPIDRLVEHTLSQEVAELEAAKLNIEKSIESLETRSKSGDMDAKVEILGHRIKLKNITEAVEKKFTAQETHNLTRKGEGASPEIRENNKTNLSLDYYNNNNRGVNFRPRPPAEDNDKISTICSFASHEKPKNLGYLKEALSLDDKTVIKIKSAIASTSVSNPDEVFKEAEFAISRRFTDKTVTHALNVFIKLLKEGRWTTPLPMRTAVKESKPSKVSHASALQGTFKEVFKMMRSH